MRTIWIFRILGILGLAWSVFMFVRIPPIPFQLATEFQDILEAPEESPPDQSSSFDAVNRKFGQDPLFIEYKNYTWHWFETLYTLIVKTAKQLIVEKTYHLVTATLLLIASALSLHCGFKKNVLQNT